MENKVYLGLGSNKGNRLVNLNKALLMLNDDSGCKVVACSSVYETLPFGGIEQPDFLNAVCLCSVSISPVELFELVKRVELKIGRTYSEKWGTREIDIDILLYNDLIYEDERLTIPHKGVLKRDFVVIPLMELDENIVYPGENIKLKDIIFDDGNKFIIKKIEANLLNITGG